MHHTSPEEANNLWQFELSRAHPEASSPLLSVTPEAPRTNAVTGMQTPLLFEELSSHITAKFSPKRADWNNMPEDTREEVNLQTIEKGEDEEEWEKDPANACMEACKNTASCFQYVWDGTTCKVSTSFFSLGSIKIEEGSSKWVSGWNLEAVTKFRKENAQCKDGSWEYNP
jgi:hypothetical protein